MSPAVSAGIFPLPIPQKRNLTPSPAGIQLGSATLAYNPQGVLSRDVITELSQDIGEVLDECPRLQRCQAVRGCQCEDGDGDTRRDGTHHHIATDVIGEAAV